MKLISYLGIFAAVVLVVIGTVLYANRPAKNFDPTFLAEETRVTTAFDGHVAYGTMLASSKDVPVEYKQVTLTKRLAGPDAQYAVVPWAQWAHHAQNNAVNYKVGDGQLRLEGANLADLLVATGQSPTGLSKYLYVCAPVKFMVKGGPASAALSQGNRFGLLRLQKKSCKWALVFFDPTRPEGSRSSSVLF